MIAPFNQESGVNDDSHLPTCVRYHYSAGRCSCRAGELCVFCGSFSGEAQHKDGPRSGYGYCLNYAWDRIRTLSARVAWFEKEHKCCADITDDAIKLS